MLENRVVLITGASRGIGKEIAYTFAKQGAHVIINYNGSREQAENVLQQIKSEDGSAELYCCNISDFSETEKMIKNIIQAHDRLDVLVNNAGITKDNLIVKMSEDEFDEVVSVNLKGTFNTIKHSVRQMMKQKDGVIINLSSVIGISGNEGQSNYAASKAGVIGLTKALAKELAGRNIRVNAIAPGFIDTEMTEKLSEEYKEKILKRIPLKRYGTKNEVADIALFLASEQACYITGQVYCIDGGLSI